MFAGCLLLSGAAMAQSVDSLPGMLNLRTGLFEVRPAMPSPAATTLYSGTFDVTITITVVSAIPEESTILCTANISGTDSTYALHGETAVTTAVRSGSTATCTLNVPYAWMLGTTPTYNFGYQVSWAAGSAPSRISELYPATSVKMPTKATTQLAAAVTL